MWCLFGKDRNGRKDEDIKSYDEGGSTTDKAPCEVSVTLSVDGEPLTLRRAYVEEWVKPRGQAEEVFRGHHTDCYWDDVPVSVTEFGKRLSALIDETTFKLLTNPEYFASLKWEDQRAILFDVAHTPSIEEIAASSPEWEGLVDKLNGKSLADFRRRIAARKFQFTHPGRGATKMAKLLFENSDVSIHAPREGCDLFLILIIRVSVCFNSRTPGGVRRHSSLSYHHKACFNSRTPGGVRHKFTTNGLSIEIVSIHAPREGCD